MSKLVLLFAGFSVAALASAPSWSTQVAHRVAQVQAQLAVSLDQCALLVSPTQLQSDRCAALAPNAQVQIDVINAQPAPSPSPSP